MFGKNDAVEMKRAAYGIPAGARGTVIAIVRRSKHAAERATPTFIVAFEGTQLARGNGITVTLHEVDICAAA